MIERERTYLAKYLPDNLFEFEFKDLIDIYIPEESDHAHLRARKNGDKYQITKKTILNNDVSTMMESTISLTKDEFEAFLNISNKKIFKRRYFYKFNEVLFEIDIFKDKLSGLVLIDIEFDNEHGLKQFSVPDFCLIEVKESGIFAGGILCSKSYEDLKDCLSKLNYEKISI